MTRRLTYEYDIVRVQPDGMEIERVFDPPPEDLDTARQLVSEALENGDHWLVIRRRAVGEWQELGPSGFRKI